MQKRLLGKQEHRQRGDAGRQAKFTETSEHAGGQDHDRRHFGGRINVVPARANVAGNDEQQRARHQQRRRYGHLVVDEQSGEAGERPEKRKGADAAESCFRSSRVSRVLTLYADRRAAENGDDQPGNGVG